MAPPPEMRVWLPWSELAGGPRVERGVPPYSSTVPSQRTADCLCPSQYTVRLWSRRKHRGLERNDGAVLSLMFQPHLLPRIQVALEQGRPIFFQGQLRCLAAEVLRLDPAHAEDGTEIPDVVLGGLLLGAGELLYKPHIRVTEDLDAMANLVADLLPISEIDSLNDGVMLFLRFYIFLTVIIPRLPQHLVTFDVSELFEKEFGFPRSDTAFSLRIYYTRDGGTRR